MTDMKGINNYFRQLSAKEINEKAHRNSVGGMWEEMGQLQMNFLVEFGLEPNHKLLDIGCGSLRGGVHYVNYLNHGNYFGLDINKSLIDAGRIEIEEAGLTKKAPHLLVDDMFSIEKFNTTFDFMISVSVFTHLPMNNIVRCLLKARESLSENGSYYATYFEAPHDAHISRIKHNPGNVTTNYDSDPFHYSTKELSYMAKLAQMDIDIIGDWKHPRNQKMAVFRLPKTT